MKVERIFLGEDTLDNESSRDKFPGQFAPGSECSKERKYQGANWPGSYRTFAPASELAWEQKGSDCRTTQSKPCTQCICYHSVSRSECRTSIYGNYKSDTRCHSNSKAENRICGSRFLEVQQSDLFTKTTGLKVRLQDTIASLDPKVGILMSY